MVGRNVFGGQVISQTLAAAYRPLEEQRQCNSLHAYFLRPGDMNARSFNQGRIYQNGKLVASVCQEALVRMIKG